MDCARSPWRWWRETTASTQLRQPLAGVAAPVVGDGGAGRGDELLVAGDRREVEQADGRGEVGGRDLAALGDGADAVVEAHARRPRWGTRCGRRAR